MRILILTALKAEAEPIINALKLVKNKTRQIYEKDNLFLAITGVGSIKAAVSVEQVLNSFVYLGDVLLLNIGIAGGPQPITSIGEMIMVNKIIKAKSGNIYLPDILIKHDLPEMGLVTVDDSVVNGSGDIHCLVDMESASIFKVAADYLPVHRLVFLKIVSDYMNCQDWTTLDIPELIRMNLGKILSLIELFRNPMLAERKILTSRDIEFLKRKVKEKRFSVTQSLKLFESAEDYYIRTGKQLTILERFFKQNINYKCERNRLYHEICQFLST